MPAPKKYDAETQERAVRMYLDRVSQGDISKLRARQEVGDLLGINESTMRNWIRRDTGPDGQVAAAGPGGAGESSAEELARLRRENAQLRKANEILKTASAFFAQAELDRKLGS